MNNLVSEIGNLHFQSEVCNSIDSLNDGINTQVCDSIATPTENIDAHVCSFTDTGMEIEQQTYTEITKKSKKIISQRQSR